MCERGRKNAIGKRRKTKKLALNNLLEGANEKKGLNYTDLKLFLTVLVGKAVAP